MILSHIVAASENHVIGKNGDLPWRIPEDFKFFKDTTKNKNIIMGRKTFESLGNPLPERRHFVITRSADFKKSVSSDILVFSSVKEALSEVKGYMKSEDEEVFIIGGGEIYKQTMDLVDRIYITRIHKEFEGDSFYPEIDMSQFTLDHEDKREGDPSFTFLTLNRK